MAEPLVDLVTLDEVQTHLDANAVNRPSDETLAALITGVSAQIQSYLSRDLVSQQYSVALSGNGGDRISLAATPITAVASLSIDGVTVPAASGATASGYVFSETQVLLRGYRFTRGVQNVELTFTGGYATIPADIRRATLEGIDAILAASAGAEVDPRAIEFQAGGTKVKLGDKVADIAALCLTPNVTSILNQQRRVAPC